MEYEFVSFCNNQYDEFNHFLDTLGPKLANKNDFLGDSWWDMSGYLRSYVFLAHDGNEFASSCFLTERELSHRGNIIPCFEIGGTATRSMHQRRGLFSKLVNCAVQKAFSMEIPLIFGTPNDRSGPGYRKLGWDFIERSSTSLILVPNVLNSILRKLNVIKSEVECFYPNDKYLLKTNLLMHELSIDQYINVTSHFSRMNFTGHGYLERRLEGRRFFFLRDGNHEFYCCLRKYNLQYLRLLLVSEYFLDGKIDQSLKKYSYIKKICQNFYKNFDGFYLDGTVSENQSKLITFFMGKGICHRKLPICFMVKKNDEHVKQAFSELSKNFQMSDCDIG